MRIGYRIFRKKRGGNSIIHVFPNDIFLKKPGKNFNKVLESNPEYEYFFRKVKLKKGKR